MSAKCFFSIYTLKKIKKSLLGCPEKYVDPCSGQPTLRSVVVFFGGRKVGNGVGVYVVSE